MTLSVFCCCCVKQLHTRYHPGVDQYYQRYALQEGTILVFEVLSHN